MSCRLLVLGLLAGAFWGCGSDPDSRNGEEVDETGRSELVVDNQSNEALSFAYVARAPWNLEDATISVPAGTRTTVVTYWGMGSGPRPIELLESYELTRKADGAIILSHTYDDDWEAEEPDLKRQQDCTWRYCRYVTRVTARNLPSREPADAGTTWIE